MPNTAILWIRDGVLVDRMHINPVAFAFAVWLFTTPERRPGTTLEDLINFGFEKSGFSCADKMRLYNSERENILLEIEEAASFYNLLASRAATTAEYFTGAADFLRDLQKAGAQNFITSAVEQDVLDAWQSTQQGQVIAPYLREILGQRHNFTKGREHFEYVSRTLGCSKIYYVADATTEIQTGKKYCQDYNITPIGFANVITVDRVLEAAERVSQVLLESASDASSFRSSLPVSFTKERLQVNGNKIVLPTEGEIADALHSAGAQTVITGSRNGIMGNLRSYFQGQISI